MLATAIAALAAVVPIVGAPVASAAKDDVNSCQATITNKTGAKVTITDARNGGGDEWVAPGDPTGKAIAAGDTFKDARVIDDGTHHCGLELRIAAVNGNDRWTVLVKYETPGKGSASCRDGSCTVTDKNFTSHSASGRFTLDT